MERLAAYALRIDGLHVVDGRNEEHAIARAIESGLLADRYAIYEKDDEDNYRVEWGGFRTSEGRFVMGAEAISIARKSDQLRRNFWRYRVREPHGVAQIMWGHWLRHEPHLSWRDVKNLDPSSLSEIRSPVLGEITGGQPVKCPHIVSRAIKCGDENGAPKVEEQPKFSSSGQWVTRDERGETVPLLAIEGYVLDNGEFVTREDIKSLFPSTDIDWEREGCARTLKQPGGAA